MKTVDFWYEFTTMYQIGRKFLKENLMVGMNSIKQRN